MPANTNKISLADQLTRSRDMTKAAVAPMMAVGMMFGKSPHLASCTDQPTIASIQINSANAIHSLALGLIQMPLIQAAPALRVESWSEAVDSVDIAPTRSVSPIASLLVVISQLHVGNLRSPIPRRLHQMQSAPRRLARHAAQTVLRERR